MKTSDSRVQTELHRMVVQQILARSVRDPSTLEAMRRVDRAVFVPLLERMHAYEDRPLPIGHGQTISQPFIVALMTAALGIESGMTLLEIGVGSGYQSALLMEMGAVVHGVERIAPLMCAASRRLLKLGYTQFRGVVADGSLGWPGPPTLQFDRIIVAAAAPRIPEPLFAQLAVNGRLVIPVGDRGTQSLLSVRKMPGGTKASETIEMVRFVPLLGKAGFPGS